MKRIVLIALIAALPAMAQRPRTNNTFASEQQTVPVVANVTGIGGKFVTWLGILNPTSTAYSVTASLYDANGTKRDAMINLAAGELKTYDNFLETVFAGYSGGGAVTFRAPSSANRFIVTSEVRSGGYSTPVATIDFPGSGSRSFSAGVSVDATSRTNIGCFNQSAAANTITATVYDKSGTQTLGTVTLPLVANAWGQTNVPVVVSDGFVRFAPQDAALCYAVVVTNQTNDGRYLPAAEYQP
ncbi:MAG TPA: hypothetical protein VNI54_10875 [Thermoanaerobaculia bacterium]|nr:hypothetical protein [Thermoanaerobaculia bacterium]